MQNLFPSLILLSVSFMSLGLGIIFFGKKNISAECGTIPGKDTNSCLSKDLGLCPLDDTEGYLRNSTIITRQMHSN